MARPKSNRRFTTNKKTTGKAGARKAKAPKVQTGEEAIKLLKSTMAAHSI